MDSGKVEVKIPADVMSLDAVGTVADKLDATLRRQGLGNVVAYCGVEYEPFTPESPLYGLKWNQITLNLDTAMEFRLAADLFMTAGAPLSSHVLYTDQMRMYGESLGRAQAFVQAKRSGSSQALHPPHPFQRQA